MQRESPEAFDTLFTGPMPVLALAPMQGVTDLPFLRLMASYGGADVYFTEYFRVHATSRLEKRILKVLKAVAELTRRFGAKTALASFIRRSTSTPKQRGAKGTR